jgi:NADH dehydrogenase [ubiquinone] 1 alpha subcomplex assembly factor 7
VTPLADILRRRIAAEGPLTVADFMTAALLHPEHGYYIRQDPFGADGDFVTAPEVSQMFGELIGLWCVAAWQQMGSPEAVNLAELGPGRGTLMSDALRAARMVPEFIAAASVHLVDASPVLRDIQRSKLSGQRVAWHEGLDGVPDGPLILVANEFFDALPIRQIVRGEAAWHERLISWEDEKFAFVLDQAPSPLAHLLPEPLRRDAPRFSPIELAPAAIGIAKAIADRVGRDGGAALIIDYGHSATAPGETLQAVRRHRSVDVLVEPGNADITAHVDFAAIGRAVSPSAKLHGPIGQGVFLRRLGIDVRRETLCAGADPTAREQIDAAYARLTAPDEMGKLFKAVAVTRHDAPAPAGFEVE